MLRILRLPPASEAEMLHSPDELRLVLQHVQLDPGARRLIDRVFDYTHRVARHVMTLRRDVVTLTAGIPFDDNLRIALANQYTRYPLVEPGTDRVVGYIHLKDIVSALASGKRPAFMRELVREPIYASEDTRLEWLRREFQRRRVHIAIILGPGHTFAGHRHAGGPARGGGRRDPGRAGRRGDPAHRAQRRRQLRGRRPADAGRRGARDRRRVPGGAAARSRRWAASSSRSCPEAPVPGDVIAAGGFRFTVLAVRDRRIRRLYAVRLPVADAGAKLSGNRRPRRKGDGAWPMPA